MEWSGGRAGHGRLRAAAVARQMFLMTTMRKGRYAALALPGFDAFGSTSGAASARRVGAGESGGAAVWGRCPTWQLLYRSKRCTYALAMQRDGANEVCWQDALHDVDVMQTDLPVGEFNAGR